MSPTFLQIALLGLIQGAAELLPVSSSAHVIAAEKLMRLDPSSPEMTFMLIMLHTGTMGAVIVYFLERMAEEFLFGFGRHERSDCARRDSDGGHGGRLHRAEENH